MSKLLEITSSSIERFNVISKYFCFLLSAPQTILVFVGANLSVLFVWSRGQEKKWHHLVVQCGATLHCSGATVALQWHYSATTGATNCAKVAPLQHLSGAMWYKSGAT